MENDPQENHFALNSDENAVSDEQEALEEPENAFVSAPLWSTSLPCDIFSQSTLSQTSQPSTTSAIAGSLASENSNYSSWNQFMTSSQHSYTTLESCSPGYNTGFDSFHGFMSPRFDGFQQELMSLGLNYEVCERRESAENDEVREPVYLNEDTQFPAGNSPDRVDNCENDDLAVNSRTDDAENSVSNNVGEEDDELQFDSQGMMDETNDDPGLCDGIANSSWTTDEERAGEGRANSPWTIDEDWDKDCPPSAAAPPAKKPILEASASCISPWDYKDLGPAEAKELILERAQELVLKIASDICDQRFPAFSKLYLTPENKLAESIINLHNPGSRYKFTAILKTISKIYSLTKSNSVINRRDFYYEDVKFFENQSTVNNAILEAAMVLRIDPIFLPFQSSVKGRMAAGSKVELFYVDDTGRHSIHLSDDGICVPKIASVLGWKKLESNAKFVLVLEKDTVFNRLCDDKVFDNLDPCILATGKGYPDKATQALVHRLSHDLKIPVFIIVDADPHGFEIAATYRWGSLAYSRIPGANAKITLPDLVLLGILPSELDSYGIPEERRLPLTLQDEAKIKSLINRFDNQLELNWSNELSKMQQSKFKAEIEALSANSPYFLSRIYIPTKVKGYFS